MSAPRLLRPLLHIVPADWRDTVARDLEDEAQADGHGRLWLASQYLRIGIRMRFSSGGRALTTDTVDVVKSLLRARGFTAAAVTTFALGIGANIAVFSIVDRVMFRPLPYAEPQRLVQIHQSTSRNPDSASALLPFWITRTIAEQSASIDGIGWAHGYVTPIPQPAGEAPLLFTPASSNALEILGVKPVLGRPFTTADRDSPERPVLITHDTWQGRFAGSHDVLSHTSRAGRETYRVVGVLPRGFLIPSSRFAERFDGMFAEYEGSSARNTEGMFTVAPFARLRPGVSTSAAQAEIDALVARETAARAASSQGTARHFKVTVQSLQSGLAIRVRPYLWLISGAVWIVLCVACVNLATLLLARGRARHYEVAVRMSIGASPGRVVARALLEALVLCALSSAVALLTCAWISTALRSVVPPGLRGFAVTPLDTRIVAITIGISLLSAVVAGLLPALAARRVDVLALLQRGGRRPRARPLRSGAALLAIEAAFGAALVVGAATAVPNFLALLLRSPGFDARDLFTITVNHGAPPNLANDPDRGERVRTILDVIRGLPSVARADAALMLPIGNGAGHKAFWKQHGIDGNVWAVGATLFDTLATPLLAGRGLSEQDVQTAAPVAVISETGARMLWPGEPIASAVQRTVVTTDGTRQVIGVVADIRKHPGSAVTPALFLPITARELRPTQTGLAVAVRMSPGAVPDRALILARLNEAFPRQAIQIQSVSESLIPWLEGPRFLAVLFGSLAAIALLLLALGLYAIAALEVARRYRETGIRLALGASTRDVQWRLVRLVLGPALAGAVAGLLATWWAGAAVQSFYADMDMRNLWPYAAALVLILSASLFAAVLPARRAGRIEPLTALRES